MRRLTSRKSLLGAFFATAVAVPAAMAWPSLAAQLPDRAARAVSVSSVRQLSTALAAAAPGDMITVAAGRYTTGTIRAARSGTGAKPITITAAKTGGATIAGTAKFDLAGVSNVVVQGFTLETGLDVPVSAKAVRVTRNTFQGNK